MIYNDEIASKVWIGMEGGMHMTDEEACEIAARIFKVPMEHAQLLAPRERDLVKAGYRAGLEEIRKETDRLSRIQSPHRAVIDDWYELLRWLDAKLKEQP